ncbi:MAG: CdaR family protein [Mobilitalea sp.]
MKKKLTRNIGLKVLSVILAAILWLVITNIDNPVIPKSFYNVPVTIVNDDAITSQGQVYEITEGDIIDFKVAARRTIAEELSVSDFKVVADFTKLSSVNAVTIDITCPRYGDDVTITNGQYQVTKVNLEDLKEEHYKINVIQNGEPAEGYYVGEKTASPNIIRVSGPKSKIERIVNVVVEADVSEVSNSFHTSGEPKALDSEGKEIDSSNLEFSETEVSININIYKTKTIKLQVSTSGELAKGYLVTNIDYEPKTIEVAGEDSALKNITSLNIVEDITGLNDSIEKEVNIQEQLEDGIILVGEDQNVGINIKIEKAETKEITIWPADLEVRNKTEGIKVTYYTTGPISIRLMGPADELDKIDRGSLKPYIDLSGYESGTYSVEVKAELAKLVTISNNPMISAYLTK